MKDIKYKLVIMITYMGGRSSTHKYAKNIGEVLNIIYDYIVYEEEDEHILALEDIEISKRIKDLQLEVWIFRNSETSFKNPIAVLDENTPTFHGFVDEMFEIEKESNGVKNENFQVLKFEKFNEAKDKFPNIKKVDIDGFTVYIGKDAKSNDYLTFNIAKPEDLWFHVKGVPGSHVVISINENLPDNILIKKVAEVAVKNSKSKSDKSKVVYCQRKFVKKESGMNDGQVKVDYVNSHVIII